MSCIRLLLRYAIIFLVFLLPATTSFAETGPFVGLAGSWSGSGTVALAGGPKERIRCRATYSVVAGGNGLRQSLRCASDSYRFDLASNVQYQNGQLSGSWSETSRNIQGTLFGRAQPGHFEVNVVGPAFLANLKLTTQGRHQSVTIHSQGAQGAGASITLTRSK